MGFRLAYPAANEQAAKSLDAANTMQLQSAAAQAAKAGTPMTSAQIAQAGGQAAGQQAQSAVQMQQQNIKAQGQAQQMAGREQAMQNQQNLAQRAIAAQRLQRQNESALFGLNENIKARLLDSQLKFERDELGRTQFNERQLTDYAIMKAKDAEQFANYQQRAAQLSKRKMQAYKTAQLKITQALQQEFTKSEAEKDNALKQKLIKAKYDIEEKIRQEQAEAAARSESWAAGGTIVGTIVGGIIGAVATEGTGTAAGAAIGGSLGGGIGKMAAAQTQEPVNTTPTYNREGKINR